MMVTTFAAFTCCAWLAWFAAFVAWPRAVDNAIAALHDGSWQEQADASFTLALLSLLAGPAAIDFVMPWAVTIMTRVARVS